MSNSEITKSKRGYKKLLVIFQLAYIWLLFMLTITAFIFLLFWVLPPLFPKASPINFNFNFAGGTVSIPSATTTPTLTPTPSPTPTPTPYVPKYGKPVRLKIPGLNIDTNVQSLGLDSNGSMDVPLNMVDVGWYNGGPVPGEPGSSVIDGHLGVNEYGVFGSLYQLKVGDLINIIDEKKQVITFRVRETKVYPRNEQPVEVFSSSQGDIIPHLNLITCDGKYNRNTGGTPNRLVVFSDLAL